MGSLSLRTHQYSLLDQLVARFLLNQPSGTKLPSETELATDLGVSRPAIREMLKELRAVGAIEIYPSKGAFIAAEGNLGLTGAVLLGRISPEELHELRTVAETYNARIAATVGDEASLSDLSSIMEEMQKSHEPEDWVDLDEAFHVQIARCTGNKALLHLLQQLRIMLMRQSLRFIMLPGRIEEANEEHRAICEAIRHHEPDEAEQFVREHLGKVAAFIEISGSRMRGQG